MALDVDEDVITTVARATTGRPDAACGPWRIEPSPHRVENMTTDRLDRVHGELDDGTPWSAFAKTLHPASASPAWQHIPPEHHAAVLEDLHWLDEPRLYRCGLADHLPEGIRMPVLLHVSEGHVSEGHEVITLWLEDVPDDGSWDLDRYHRSARVLGRLGGRWPEELASAQLGMRRRPIERLWFGKLTHLDLVLQAEDAFWEDPAVASVVDDRHRADLERLRDAMPGLLARLGALPHGLAHGDATPDNLREPGDGTVVAIDWSYGSCAPLGSDLGQLLAGRVESGAGDLLEPGQLSAVGETIVDGYLEGLADEGCAADRSAVEEAWATNLAVRSVFSALILDHRPDLCGAARHDLLGRRAALGRFGLDLALRVLAGA
jgi:hypothetical protein